MKTTCWKTPVLILKWKGGENFENWSEISGH